MRAKTAYILYLVEETENEVKEIIYAVFSDREQAEIQGKGLVELGGIYIDHHISGCLLFDNNPNDDANL